MDTIEPWARKEIQRRLEEIRTEEGVRFLIAVESGSRAWGFPSPDSDYDVRFIYLRPWAEYARLRPLRDVIERDIVDDFDVSGWDLRKAMALLLSHNAVVAEWFNSPIRYLPDDQIAPRIAELADRFFNPRGYALHYASLGRNNVQRWNEDAQTIAAKRYFYALRPALCIRALRLNPGSRPPMNLQSLMAAVDLEPELEAEIDHLVELKASAREAAGVERSIAVERLITEELNRAYEVVERRDDDRFAEAAEEIFLDALRS